MKIRILADNNTIIDRYYLGEPAASFYIQADNRNLLFDAGYSDVFKRNAQVMGIDLSSLDVILISHGHNDHTGGLAYLGPDAGFQHVKLVAHPDCFLPKEYEGEDIGSPMPLREIKERFRYIPAAAPFFVTENCVFLGRIPRINDFECTRPVGMCRANESCRDKGGWRQDFLEDDSALACTTPHGLFIVTGCSHSGICNIVDYAIKVWGDTRILGILGGFHLFDVDEQLKRTISYLKDKGIGTMYPCHCVSLKVKAKLMEHFHVEEVGVGMEIELPG